LEAEAAIKEERTMLLFPPRASPIKVFVMHVEHVSPWPVTVTSKPDINVMAK